MAKLTGLIIREKYAPQKKFNSFYEEQKSAPKIGPSGESIPSYLNRKVDLSECKKSK